MNGNKSKPTGYALSKAFYTEVEASTDMQARCTAHHHSLYTWICELSNRFPSREVYDLPRDYTMTMSFIGSPSTFKKVLDDLVLWGIFEIVQVGTNIWQPTKVCFSGSFLNKYCTATEQLVNTSKTIKTEETKDNVELTFEEFWNAYGKKEGSKKNAFNSWKALSKNDRQAAFDTITAYKIARPDRQFRKNPEGYLRHRIWENDFSTSPKESDTAIKAPVAAPKPVLISR